MIGTTTIMAESVSSATYGAETSETFTVTVTGQSGDGYPEGIVSIENSSTELCSHALAELASDEASASCSLGGTELAVGHYTDVFATFTPGSTSSSDESYSYSASSSSPVRSFRVTKDTTTTTVSVSPTNVAHGDESAALFTVTVTAGHGQAVPNGETVTVKVGTATCTVTLEGGHGTCRIANSALGVGTYAVSATYGGDKHFTGSSAASVHRLTVSRASRTFLPSFLSPFPGPSYPRPEGFPQPM